MLINWTLPSHGWIKVNIDGNLNCTNTGIGGLFKDVNGKCIVFLASPCVASSPLETETRAALGALQITISYGLSHIILETDSLVLFQILMGFLKPDWNITILLNRIKDMVIKFHFQIQYALINREANRPADWLAKKGHLGIIIGENPTCPLYNLTLGDVLDAPYM
ncbi:uncharacterized protein LOC110030308 [Phalaenopsis equestris]|uniref:uncharacterized protein LOC110030308 n=1 Tax=Phalaenopsis equestris TaxID=78828 RepID=UPI0009E372FD|nr:uncharacterized protein LOC110030308 [Phalaenopsis equestris]